MYCLQFPLPNNPKLDISRQIGFKKLTSYQDKCANISILCQSHTFACDHTASICHHTFTVWLHIMLGRYLSHWTWHENISCTNIAQVCHSEKLGRSYIFNFVNCNFPSLLIQLHFHHWYFDLSILTPNMLSVWILVFNIFIHLNSVSFNV